MADIAIQQLHRQGAPFHGSLRRTSYTGNRNKGPATVWIKRSTTSADKRPHAQHFGVRGPQGNLWLRTRSLAQSNISCKQSPCFIS